MTKLRPKPKPVALSVLILSIWLTFPVFGRDPIRWLIDPKPAGLDPSRSLDAASQKLHALIYTTLGEKGLFDAHMRASEPQRLVDCVSHYQSQGVYRNALASLGKIQVKQGPSKRYFVHFEHIPTGDLRHFLKELFWFQTSKGVCLSGAPGELPLSSGKYRVQDWNPEHLRLRSEIKPPLDLIWIGDELAKYRALHSGEIDLTVSGLSLSKTRHLRAQTGNTFLFRNAPGYPLQYLAFHTGKAPFQDVEVRQKLARTIPRAQILMTRLAGFGRPRNSYFLEGESTAIDPIGEDLSSAKALSGVLKGVEFEFRTTPSREGLETAQILQSAWNAAGAQVSLRIVEGGIFLRSLQTGEVPIFLSRWIGKPDWVYLRRILHSQGDLNRAHYQNTQMDRWIEQGLKADSPQLRTTLADRIQKKWNQDLPYVLLWSLDQTLVARRERFSPEVLRCFERWNSGSGDWKSVVNCLL